MPFTRGTDILKDTFLVSFLLTGFGLAVWGDVRLRGMAALAGLVGMLARTNGVFAAPPLFLLCLRRNMPLLRTAMWSFVLAVALIPTSQWINHAILRASPTHQERALQLYDLTGIAYFSGDKSVLPVDIPDVEGCYVPLFWDDLKYERCGKANSKIRHDLTRVWLAGIVSHPAAYAEHRIAHFNREIFFLVPPAEQCVDAPELHDCPKSLISDLVVKNCLLWPVTWLALGLVMLFGGLGTVPRALCLSGLLYGFAYLAVGLAADFRYFYWTEIAIQTALIMQVGVAGFPRWRWALAAILAVWVAGYSWRFLSLAM